ncbi:complement component 1 Q subcomponent-binding protein, mitochondrial-like [Stegodyphus dumicola]|uniref:complement component 1 Q subcomponent-binding protein, mitochondrial-like n=1 Tax=Stegodyphus dumicola TaxID=202533 RepID=UPI0015ADAB82|nr:complement component 1 Q subcomponent-binding protein, mitochondrial-like [Stegodyphus dumicola]
MSFHAIRSVINFSKTLSSSKALLSKSLSKSLFYAGGINTRTLSRSLFCLSRNRDSDLGRITSKVTSWSNTCGCGCSLHTKGDQELASFLAEEIENENKVRVKSDLPKLEGFEYSLSEADVTLTKKFGNEIITIKANVNDPFVSDSDDVMDPNETQETQQERLQAKPQFTVEVKKGNKTLSFTCSYSEVDPNAESEAYSDSFEITDVALYEGDSTDSTYYVAGEVMDGYLYDLLMNYLEERGISNEFADKMIAFFTSYEHQLYIRFLQGMKSFVEK